MDLTRLGTGYRIAAGAAVLLFIDLWLSWYGISGAGGLGDLGIDTTANAFQAFSWTDLWMLLTVVAAIGAAVVHVQNMDGALPFPAPMAVIGLAGWSALLVFYRVLINKPGDGDIIELDAKFGAYLGFILLVLIAVGGYMALTEKSAAPAAAPPAAPPVV